VRDGLGSEKVPFSVSSSEIAPSALLRGRFRVRERAHLFRQGFCEASARLFGFEKFPFIVASSEIAPLALLRGRFRVGEWAHLFRQGFCEACARWFRLEKFPFRVSSSEIAPSAPLRERFRAHLCRQGFCEANILWVRFERRSSCIASFLQNRPLSSKTKKAKPAHASLTRPLILPVNPPAKSTGPAWFHQISPAPIETRGSNQSAHSCQSELNRIPFT